MDKTHALSATEQLSNRLLVAMPTLGDPIFNGSLALVCEHNENGAFGILINRPLEMKLHDIFDQLDLDDQDAIAGHEIVLQGGPVHQHRGFVVHQDGSDWESSFKISEDLKMTTSKDILAAMARGEGPDHALIAVGYAGWAAGQLEQEILSNAWLTAPADRDILFDTPVHQRREAAVAQLGIDLESLNHLSGHA